MGDQVAAAPLDGERQAPEILLQFGDLAKAVVDTEQKKASQYARSLIEASLDPLVTISAEGKITDVNEGSVKVTGMPREKLIGTDFSDYFTEPEKAREGYKRVFSLGSVTDYPLTIRHRDGRLTDVLYNASVYKDSLGEVLGVFAAARDITDRTRIASDLKKTSDELNAIVETMRDPLLLLDAELRVKSANQTFFDSFGVDAAETLERPIYELGNGQWDIPELRLLLEEILPANASFVDFTVTHDCAQLGRRTMLLNARRLQDASGQIHRIVLVIADITERTRIASELKKTSNELLRSNAELDQFAAVASHDLQEPLRMIVSYVDLLNRKYGYLFDDQAKRYMGYIADGGIRMTEMIRAILAYSQIGHESSKMSSVDSSIALGNAVANLQARVADTQATIVDGPLPSVTANVNQLSQLFQNLLSNAMKFRSDHRACAIQVRAVEAEHEWTFSVADNGIGMDQEGAPRIFQLFQRLHARDKYPGSGIGLATCKKIVEHHSGRIWVESTPDVGSTFFFTLPKR